MIMPKNNAHTKNRSNWIKGITFFLIAAIVMSVAVPVPAMAADKMSVKVVAPEKNAKATAKKLTIHTKSPVQLKVTYNGRDVTKNAAYKVNNKVIRVKGGKVTVKKNGKAQLTVKYKGMSKELDVTVSGHSWKAHKVTKTVKKYVNMCWCGKYTMTEKKYCAKCQAADPYCKENNLCWCKTDKHMDKHIRKGEPSNFWGEYIKEKVTHTDYYKCACGAKKSAKK